MLNDAIRSVQYGVVWTITFLVALVVSIAIPEAIRRRWPILVAAVIATAIVVVEAATDEQRVNG